MRSLCGLDGQTSEFIRDEINWDEIDHVLDDIDSPELSPCVLYGFLIQKLLS